MSKLVGVVCEIGWQCFLECGFSGVARRVGFGAITRLNGWILPNLANLKEDYEDWALH
jgi:hypothetical protein